MTSELTCRELVEVVSDYLEDRLPPRDRLRFEEHIVICAGCTAHLEQMRQAILLIGELREVEMAPEARDGLLRAFRDWKAGLG